MKNTAKMLDEIAGLKEELHNHKKAIAEIKFWLLVETGEKNAMAREIERQTLETVLRIFKEG